MSNRIDFFQSEHTSLAIPAATVSVFIDGCLCPDLVPLEIVRSGWPEFGWVRLALNGSVQPVSTGEDNSDSDICSGKAVCIRQCYNVVPPGVAIHSLPLFSGQIDTVEMKLGSEGNELDIVARDFSANLRRITVYGRRTLKQDGSSVMLPGLDTLFNPYGRANAGIDVVVVNGRAYTLFDVESSQSKLWTYADVIDYLLSEYVPVGQLYVPGKERLNSLTEGQIVRDLDVTGLSLLDALRRCCERIGLEFKFVPRLSETGPAQAIVFYQKGAGRTVELCCQRPGEKLSISKTNVAAIHSSKEFYPVTHRYVGQGDFKVFEATFDLVKAWDESLEDTCYETFSPLTNPDFYQVRDVYRKWCLNEAGDYTDSPYGQGDAFDFSKIFDTSDYTREPRRFWPCLSSDKQGRSLGYYLQVSFNGGSTWWQYLYAFNNMLDECGIWLSSDQLDLDTWIATVKGLLKFRITASVVSDERLSCVVADGPINSTAPVIDRVLILPQQFKYRRVSTQSIFFDSSEETLGPADQADDTVALYEFVRHRSFLTEHAIERAKVQTPCLDFGFQAGDRISIGALSRDLLSLKSDNRSICWIERVHIDFVKQCTGLDIVRIRT